MICEARFPFKRTQRTQGLAYKEKYASKIKSAQETQETQENYASKKKQKYASATHAVDASGPCTRKRNDRIDSIFHATHATQMLALRALRAFEWKPGFSHTAHVIAIWLDVCPSVRLSVRLFVRHTLVLCRNGSTYRQTVFTAW